MLQGLTVSMGVLLTRKPITFVGMVCDVTPTAVVDALLRLAILQLVAFVVTAGVSLHEWPRENKRTSLNNIKKTSVAFSVG